MPYTTNVSKLGNSTIGALLLLLPIMFPTSPVSGDQPTSPPALVFLTFSPDLGEGLSVRGFRVIKDVDVRIDAMGSGVSGTMYAYPWILDAVSRKVVWEMSFANSRKAGRKDRIASSRMTLPPGSYLVYFAVARIKDIPVPLGPMKEWLKGVKDAPSDLGITLSTATAEDRLESVEPYEKDKIGGEKPEIAVSHLGDSAYVRTRFRMQRDGGLKIYALGEGGVYGGRMADYSWIVDSVTRKRVWEMKAAACKHAGGVKKNLVFKGTNHLKKGTYELFTITDDAHSTDRWYSLPPYDPDRWGISIYADKGTVIPMESSPQEEVLARLTGVGNDETIKAGFSLSAPCVIHIYAFGEWLPGSEKMADYGWIVNSATNQRVWKMEPNETEHGGGNVKNRLVDRLLNLEPGDYLVYYRTDDSHSFESWNESPPFDQARYGITLSLHGEGADWQQIT